MTDPHTLLCLEKKLTMNPFVRTQLYTFKLPIIFQIHLTFDLKITTAVSVSKGTSYEITKRISQPFAPLPHPPKNYKRLS